MKPTASLQSRFIPASARLLLVGALWLGTCLAAQADVILRGTVGARTIEDNVVIPAYATCTLNGTVIKGNLRVLAGARLFASGARVEGDVQAFDSFVVDLRQGTSVGGNVQGEGGTRSIVVRGGTQVTGSVQLKAGFAPTAVDALLIQQAVVGGDVQAEQTNGRLRVLSSQIGGALQWVENRRGPYAILSSQIGGDLQFFKNLGTGAVMGSIVGNRVGGNLQSKENSPRIVVRNNAVEGSLEVQP